MQNWWACKHAKSINITYFSDVNAVLQSKASTIDSAPAAPMLLSSRLKNGRKRKTVIHKEYSEGVKCKNGGHANMLSQ